MSDKYIAARKQTVDCVTSLHKAVQDAGGTILGTEKLENMTVMEFVTTIAAQNNIRFHYKQPKNDHD